MMRDITECLNIIKKLSDKEIKRIYKECLINENHIRHGSHILDDYETIYGEPKRKVFTYSKEILEQVEEIEFVRDLLHDIKDEMADRFSRI